MMTSASDVSVDCLTEWVYYDTSAHKRALNMITCGRNEKKEIKNKK